ncbi:MAG: ABC transporter ATP-binding protein [Actinobacteria bacterium]|nr:ABC transporter ATP-binding protein [Actinomycetota bacterium]
MTDLRVNGPAGTIVSQMDLDVGAGETVALVGESGSGKSMTAKAVTGLLPRGVVAAGTLGLGDTTVELAGGPAALTGLRGRRISLLLQNPFTSLSPVHRCGRQIAAALPVELRRSDAEVARRLEEVDLPARVARQYPFELSGGMRQRVALAASLASDPEVLIGDEPTTALDVTTQREVLDLLARIQRERGMALLLITHDLGVARERADRILVMYAGRLVESGAGDAILTSPRHPYTAGLRDSDPPLDRRVDRLSAVPGSVPRPWEVVAGCAFAPRCAFADDRCRHEAPPLESPSVGSPSVGANPTVPDHPTLVACWRPLDPATAVTVVVAAAARDQQAPMPLLSITGLTKRFSSDAPPALDDVSITVGAGESVGIVGESGSGKTTLARCLVGLERADAGTIDWTSSLPTARRAQIVFQDPTSALNPSMTIGAALSEALRAGGQHEARSVADLLALVGLPLSYTRRRPASLSGGEQQRVAIARALAPAPQLLICDEAVSSLDVSVQAQILNLLADLLDELGLALLFITHDLAVVRQVARRVYVMRDGRVVESGETEALLTAPSHAYTRALFASVPGRRGDQGATAGGADDRSS